MKKTDVCALGELLIDLTENGISSQGNPLFEANPGGAVCNVLSMLAKLGHKTAFIGKVGRDFFGKQLKEALTEAAIDPTYLYESDIPTTLALVKNTDDGDRDFSFYRNPGADMMLNEDEVPKELIADSKIFHFGTLSMTHEGVRKATKKALDIAKEAGILISFDPNLRPPLWDSLDNARQQVVYGLGYCDILKISDDELRWLTSKDDLDEGIDRINERFSIPLILLTMGKSGSRAYYKGKSVEEKAYVSDKTIDTTGAGDTFLGCILHFLCQKDINGLSEEDLRRMLRFANAGASLITLRKGALRVMPDKEEIEDLIKNE